jgi:hypothetical protein
MFSKIMIGSIACLIPFFGIAEEIPSIEIWNPSAEVKNTWDHFRFFSRAEYDWDLQEEDEMLEIFYGVRFCHYCSTSTDKSIKRNSFKIKMKFYDSYGKQIDEVECSPPYHCGYGKVCAYRKTGHFYMLKEVFKKIVDVELVYEGV